MDIRSKLLRRTGPTPEKAATVDQITMGSPNGARPAGKILSLRGFFGDVICGWDFIAGSREVPEGVCSLGDWGGCDGKGQHHAGGDAISRAQRAELNVVAATQNKVTAEYVVKSEHCNNHETLHGGFTATAIDFLTTVALMIDEEDSRPGVSLNLSVNYLKALKVGEKVTVEGEVLRKGRSVAYTTARILNEKGDLAAHGTHIKHLGQ
eukprot:XP_011684044.1 PREDICTED: acyl-coenzyme A thioesterase 13-like [Strongylocentrotus purpuratus]